jgi:hypothetical protein
MRGFFCLLLYHEGMLPDMMFVVDLASEHLLLPACPIRLGGDFVEGIAYISRAIQHEMRAHFKWIPDFTSTIHRVPGQELADMYAPLVSTVLYLCSTNAEIPGHDHRPPRPVKTKHGPRLFPPDKPRVWEVACRLGSALRRGTESERHSPSTGTHASPRPHIRRAHWHSFWTGQRSSTDGSQAERKVVLYWLPPIAVNVATEAPIIPTVRTVKRP